MPESIHYFKKLRQKISENSMCGSISLGGYEPENRNIFPLKHFWLWSIIYRDRDFKTTDRTFFLLFQTQFLNQPSLRFNLCVLAVGRFEEFEMRLSGFV